MTKQKETVLLLVFVGAAGENDTTLKPPYLGWCTRL